jgi:DNA-binding CsgD family transcriptional regulator
LSLIQRGWAAENPAYRQIFTTQFMPDATVAQMNWFNELQRLSTSTENAVRFQMEVGQIDVSRRLSEISAPTLVFHCRQDARVPFEEGRFIAATIPSARFVELSSRSHILLDTDPAWPVFCAELRRFLDEGGSVENPQLGILPGPLEDHLTQRELEVLRLISRGKTDREIAAELFISARTVGNHVKNILTKTDCPNRTAAAIYAAKRGLL